MMVVDEEKKEAKNEGKKADEPKATPTETPVKVSAPAPEPEKDVKESSDSSHPVPESEPDTKEPKKEEKAAAVPAPKKEAKAEAKPESKKENKPAKAEKADKAPKKEKPMDVKLVEEMKEKKKKQQASKKEEKNPVADMMPPLFGKYDFTSVAVSDPGLKKYININPVGQPHTAGRYSAREFGKHRMNIIERLINNMMRTEEYTGKKSKTYTVVKRSFAIIEKREKNNPVQVFIQALENSAPREEVTRLRFGGISVPKAVDISPARRLDFALRNICRGAVNATYKKKTPIQNCLANEIIMASKGDMNSFAVQKKDEIERVAGSAR
jgi:small subunit ribosomal protein S7